MLYIYKAEMYQRTRLWFSSL